MVDLGLTARVVKMPPSDGIGIMPGAWLEVHPSVRLWDGDVPSLMRGLRRVAPKFRSVLAGGGEVVLFSTTSGIH